MADQVTGVQITLGAGSPPTTYNVQIGPNGFNGLSIADLFNRTEFDPDHLFGNVRLKKVIGFPNTHIASKEFADAINQNGIKTTGGTFYHVGFAKNSDGSVTVAFGSQVGSAPNQSITFEVDAFNDDTHDLNMVLLNIGSFLREAGFDDLTTLAANGIYQGKTGIQAVASHTFWF